MPRECSEDEWREAIDRVRRKTENALRQHSNECFWREHDLQGYMYKAFFEEAVLRPYVRREHRIWRDISNENISVLILDFALLDPAQIAVGYPDWPVKEMIQLKFPVEFATGLTEPQKLEGKKDTCPPDYYTRLCRTRIRGKIWKDYRKYLKAVGKTRNVSNHARCHMMYFDLADRPSYSGSEELVEDLRNWRRRDGRKMNPDRVGSWPLVITYAHSTPAGEESDETE